ncbi:hypothetical protein PHSY_001891 [Pseudozyma hubeiensis SY62]|uniref:Uncharacterized protein n=1 Tax=Pseudozyma hubeiensis (strain SY62) TaxID=1305764 RepID=R9P8D8_PSEHS|nr:hypothetical protein PHSY_001891 [Pseudozyma hubeiensis SY62]GAC94320.1 hypothetical protein PHSY_001891 [Pseudozyma hubeiensis SY62]
MASAGKKLRGHELLNRICDHFDKKEAIKMRFCQNHDRIDPSIIPIEVSHFGFHTRQAKEAVDAVLLKQRRLVGKSVPAQPSRLDRRTVSTAFMQAISCSPNRPATKGQAKRGSRSRLSGKGLYREHVEYTRAIAPISFLATDTGRDFEFPVLNSARKEPCRC